MEAKKEEILAFAEAGRKRKLERIPAADRRSLRVTREQGLWIQYQLRLKDATFADVAAEVKCERQAVQGVVSGKWHSKRIEAAVARRLGYKSWNEMVRRLREGER